MRLNLLNLAAMMLFALANQVTLEKQSAASLFGPPIYSGRGHFVTKQIRSVPRPLKGGKYII